MSGQGLSIFPCPNQLSSIGCNYRGDGRMDALPAGIVIVNEANLIWPNESLRGMEEGKDIAHLVEKAVLT